MPVPEKPHLDASRFLTSSDYKPRGGGAKPPPFARDRATHGAAITRELAALHAQTVGEESFTVTIECERDIYQTLTSFDDGVSGKFELLQIKEAGGTVTAEVSLTQRGLAAMERKADKYLNGTGPINRPDSIPNQRLINAIRSIRVATARELVSDLENIPAPDELIWWEVWLLAENGHGRERDVVEARARAICARENIPVSATRILIPERTIIYLRTTLDSLAEIRELLWDIAELRRAQILADSFADMTPAEHGEWAREMAGRVTPPADDAVIVALLDTGVMRTHALLQPVIAPADALAVHGATAQDGHPRGGHGTGMASLILYGCLRDPFLARQPIQAAARIRSVNLFPPAPRHAELQDDETVALIAAERSRMGVEAAEGLDVQPHAYCHATTSRPTDGTPDTWSSVIDHLACGGDAATPYGNERHRLILVSAGNVSDPSADTPDRRMESPANAWNALTIGGYTKLTSPSPNRRPAVPPLVTAQGSHSPWACTTEHWSADRRPIKPEVVFEAGNHPDLPEFGLLTAAAVSPGGPLLVGMHGTSPATALATQFIAKLAAVYPRYAPEMLRALMVHSAEWTDAMRARLPRNPTKADYCDLARVVGYGVPSLEKAIDCSTSRATMVMDGQISPYRMDGSKVKYNQMALFDLTEWPLGQIFRANPNADIRLRVTLSYFIEPNPGRRAYTRDYSYTSYGLRFELSRSNETLAQFRLRINSAIEAEDDETAPDETEGDKWLFGSRSPMRTCGSLHSDQWKGSAADVINPRYIAVYPSHGWWRSRKKLNRYDESAKFSLVVSLETSAELDLYAPLARVVAGTITVPVEPIPVEG